MTSVGIIGFGSFGAFLAEKLDPHTAVRVFSKSQRPNKWAKDLSLVASSDYLILAVPIEAYHPTLEEIKDLIAPDTVIVDVCSVKEEPIQIIKEVLPAHKLVATHPLFGPESAADSLEGHVLALCPEASDEEALGRVEQFASSLGLIVKKMTADEHDLQMATVQGLTFFIAHVLKECNLHDQVLSTASFKRLLSLAELERRHSDELFYTIQMGNRHTQTVRENFIRHATQLNERINNK